jgi:hypothetical protein
MSAADLGRVGASYDACMKLVMTMMVRDEIDIVAPVIEHHLDQGVDLIMVTDNASVDGTTEVLQQYADLGVVELHHDPEHRKQQGERVTTMARRARTEHAADWVINGDADEFVVPVDRSLTVREALEHTPLSLTAFTVPVINMVGPPALRGPGISRLVWRDLRSTEDLVDVGIHAQPTPNAIHRGDPEVTVAQGNHFVSLPSHGQPDEAVALEVLHLPWRSWDQFERKVVSAGRAYEASPHLRPSKNHHGMADYRRWQAGRLQEAFHLRMPQADALEGDPRFVHDDWLAGHLEGLVSRARLPDLLQDALALEDVAVDAADHERDRVHGVRYLALERERDAYRDDADRLRGELAAAQKQVAQLRRQRDRARRRADAATAPVPLTSDVRRVGRRAAGAVRRRLVRPGE